MGAEFVRRYKAYHAEVFAFVSVFIKKHNRWWANNAEMLVECLVLFVVGCHIGL